MNDKNDHFRLSGFKEGGGGGVRGNKRSSCNLSDAGPTGTQDASAASKQVKGSGSCGTAPGIISLQPRGRQGKLWNFYSNFDTLFFFFKSLFTASCSESKELWGSAPLVTSFLGFYLLSPYSTTFCLFVCLSLIVSLKTHPEGPSPESVRVPDQ